MFRSVQRRLRSQADAAGFSLVEVVIAVALIGVLATVSLNLYFTSADAAQSQKNREVAITVANAALESVNAISVGSLIEGRDRATVESAWTANAAVGGAAQSSPLWDTTASASSVRVVPISATEVLSGTRFAVTTLIGRCFQPVAGGTCIKPTTVHPYSTPAGRSPLSRIVVVVNWGAAGSACVRETCYTATTLVDANPSDPVWKISG